MSAREVRWQVLNREALRHQAELEALAIVPVGSIEQHGPHLPLDTDAFTAEVIARRAAEGAGFPVLVLPTVHFGVSEYWMGFPGTISVRPSTLAALLEDVCRSIARHGVSRIVLLNGHAGNAGVIQSVAASLAAREARVVGLNYWNLVAAEMRATSRADGGFIGHAGEVETALQLALRADQVANIPDDADWLALPPEGGLPFDLVLAAPDPDTESPSGIYGNPSAATAELGERILAAAVDRLIDLLVAIRDLPVSAGRGNKR